MKKFLSFFLLVPVFLIGCEPADTTAPMPDETAAESNAGEATGETAGTSIELNGENTTIQFTGLHKGDLPNPRVGVFTSLEGTASVADGKLVTLDVTINTDSLSINAKESGLDGPDDEGKPAGLEGHLNNADFFNTAQFPTAKFTLTNVEEADGKTVLVGDLTILEETKSIKIPATVSTEGGLSIDGETEIDRMEFGMDYKPEGIEEMVKLKITVAAK